MVNATINRNGFPKNYLKVTFFALLLNSVVSSSIKSNLKQEDDSWQMQPFEKLDDVNPILGPLNTTEFLCPVRNQVVKWESKDIFNPTALVRYGKIHLLYRAEDVEGEFLGTSRIGLATSEDGVTFVREPEPIFYPDNDNVLEHEWEGGCEDPRIVETADGMYVMTYTGYNGSLAILMVATTNDLRNWTKYGPVFRNSANYSEQWSKSGSIVTTLIDNKFVATKINDLYWMYWGDKAIHLAISTDLVDWRPLVDGEGKLLPVFSPRVGKFDNDLVEPGPQALLRDDGILLIYNSRYLLEEGVEPILPQGTYSAGQILFDKNYPVTVLKRSENYFMTPDRDYEIIGQVNNVVFLEGLVCFRGKWFLYYGTADSKIAVATREDQYCPSEEDDSWEMKPFEKLDEVNPILGPLNTTEFLCPVRNEVVKWEAKDIFNPTALVRDGKINMLYRAEDFEGVYNGTSRIGLATSEDGINFVREPEPIFYPDNEFNDYEWEGGCEDPRIVESEDGMYVMTYTGYNGSLAILMVATSNDLRSWTKYGPVFRNSGQYSLLWSKSGSIVSTLVKNKFIATKINGLYWMYWGENDIYLATSTDLVDWNLLLDDDGDVLPVFSPRVGRFDSDIVEPGPQALVRDDGILLIYNSRNKDKLQGGDSHLPRGTYSAGQILFDKTSPVTVLKRSEYNFFKPDRDYEITGQVNNVVFLEGLVCYKGKWFLYYGTADSKIAVATREDQYCS